MERELKKEWLTLGLKVGHSGDRTPYTAGWAVTKNIYNMQIGIIDNLSREEVVDNGKKQIGRYLATIDADVTKIAEIAGLPESDIQAIFDGDEYSMTAFLSVLRALKCRLFIEILSGNIEDQSIHKLENN